MKLKEMSLFEAAEKLDLEIEETVEGVKLTHGENDSAAYADVTLETVEERINESNEAFQRLVDAKYSPMIYKMVEELIVDSFSAWTAVASHLKAVEAEKAKKEQE